MNSIITVIGRLLQKSTHQVEGRHLAVQIYHKELGILPPGYDTSNPATCIPSGIDCLVKPPCIVQFWLKSGLSRKSIEKELKPLHCTIQWPTQSNDPLRLLCELKQHMPNIQSLVRDWEEQVRDAMHNMRNAYYNRNIQSLQHTWEPFLEKVGDLTPENTDLLDIHVNASQHEIVLVGKQDEVTTKWKELKQALKEIVDAMSREAKSIVEIINDLSLPQLKLLAAHNMPNRMMATFPHLKYTIAEGQIVIKGLPDDIVEVKLSTYQCVNNPSSRFIQVPLGLRELMKRNAVQEVLTEKLNQENVTAVWETVEDGVKLYCITENKIAKGVQIVNDCLFEKEIKVSSKGSKVLRGKKWKYFKEHINTNAFAHIDVQKEDGKSCVIVDATDDVFTEIVDQVLDFLDEYKIIDSFLQVPLGLARFIEKQMPKELEEIRESVNREVNLDIVYREGEHGIQLEGTSVQVNVAKEQLKQLLTDKIQEKHYTVTTIGMNSVFSGTRGSQFCEGLEARLRTTVQIAGDAGNPFSGRKVKVKSTVKFEGTTLLVAKADLPSYQVDAIVNAANRELNHIGGLAKAIVNQGEQSAENNTCICCICLYAYVWGWYMIIL